jgi:hypothetical protein
MNDIIETIGTLLLGITGPILCYIIVYGSVFIFNRIYLHMKAKKFYKHIAKTREKMGKDCFDDIEVEVIASYGDDEKEKIR